jgi:hypothetical protein
MLAIWWTCNKCIRVLTFVYEGFAYMSLLELIKLYYESDSQSVALSSFKLNQHILLREEHHEIIACRGICDPGFDQFVCPSSATNY